MVGDVGERAADYGLTDGQQDFLEWVRRVAASLADVPPVHGAVNRPLIATLGERGPAPRRSSAADATSRRATRPRCSCACSARDWPRSTPRPRRRSPCRGSARYPILQSGNRRDPRPVAARGGQRRRRTGVRAVRARRRLGRRRARPRGRGRTATAGRLHGDEDLDLQRPRRRRLHGLRPYDARRQGARRHGVRGAGDAPGPDRRAPRHGRAARARHPPLRRRAGLPRRRARRGRRGLRRRDAHPRPVPARASARSRSGWRRRRSTPAWPGRRSASSSAGG